MRARTCHACDARARGTCDACTRPICGEHGVRVVAFGLETFACRGGCKPLRAPECPRCEGTGRIGEQYANGGYGRALPDRDCDQPGCTAGRLDEQQCTACDATVALPREDASPHFCEFVEDAVHYLCPTCASDPWAHAGACAHERAQEERDRLDALREDAEQARYERARDRAFEEE